MTLKGWEKRATGRRAGRHGTDPFKCATKPIHSEDVPLTIC
jgi:hypothetical protein